MRVGVGMLLAGWLAAAAPPALAQDFSWMFAEGKPDSIRTLISESMTPALQIGDRAAVFTLTREPRRGDILMFSHPRAHDPVPWLKRVVGLPGDRVQMTGGRLFLNGVEVQRTLVRTFSYLDPNDWTSVVKVSEYTEQLPGEDAPHLIHEYSDIAEDDDTREFIVPAGHLFMVGDNRDNSFDSRDVRGYPAPIRTARPGGKGDRPYVAPTEEDIAAGRAAKRLAADIDPNGVGIGFVPVANIIGRVRTVMLTIRPCQRAKAEAAGAECLVPAINKRL